MKQTTFSKKVCDEIEQFFLVAQKANGQVIYHNELELQMLLCQHLMKKFNVQLECHVPTNGDTFTAKADYPWRTKDGKLQEMYVDIVVNDGKEWVPIEVKYKTRGLVEDGLLFGQPTKNLSILKNQGAQDLGMYGFWKDVRRVEMLCKTYPTVKNGIAIFVTNDPYYVESPKGKEADKVNYYAFRMTEGRTASGRMDWKNRNSKIAASYPAFKLDGQYTIHWEPVGAHSTPRDKANFRYCMVTI
jgi:hypothetical protein